LFESQFQRAEELLSDLEVEYLLSLKNKEVSDRAKILTRDYCITLNSILDQVMNKYFEEKIAPTLSSIDRTEAKKRIYFPISNSRNGLPSKLGQMKIKNLQKMDYKVFSFLKSCQPYYDSSYKWLLDLHKYTNERHVRLTPQKKTENTRFTVNSKEGCVIILDNVIAEDGGILIDGKKIHSVLASTPESSYISCDPRLDVTTEILVNFYFEGTDLEVLKFCKECLPKTKELVKQFLELFKILV